MLSVRKLFNLLPFFILTLPGLSCSNRYDYPIPPNSFSETELPPPVKVTLSKSSGSWKMFVNGTEFYVKGAATNNFFENAKEFGANTIRTYGITEQTRVILDKAFKAGLQVNLGIYIKRELDGFDYNNDAAVKEQLEQVKADVIRFKDHPALLCWSIGNEVDASYTNTKVWTVVNEVAKFIHQVDPNHPVTTALANSDAEKVKLVAQMAPQVDILSINSYAPNVPQLLANLTSANWQKPYMVTEFGPRGTWQMNPEPARVLSWGGLVEQTSTEKEADYLLVYQNHIYPNRTKGCIGSFVFLWGYQTHGDVLTWFGLFDKRGYTFAAADAMQYAWTGSYPANRAPVIQTRNHMLMNNKKAEENITVARSSSNTATVTASDPEGDVLTYSWMIYKENTFGADGSLPNGIGSLITDSSLPAITFKAPGEAGAYRLVVFVSDETHKKVASAVIPFLVN